MKRISISALVFLTIFFLSACRLNNLPSALKDHMKPKSPLPSITKETESEQTFPAEPEVTETEPVQTITAETFHSTMSPPGVPVEDVICYFNEVCLDGEIINSGDPSYVQKWTQPIHYSVAGDYTDSDIATIEAFETWLNDLHGFPGISRTSDPFDANLRIHFCNQEEMLELMGSDFTGLDGAVTFWYTDDEIYNATICCRTDLDRELRNSVIIEEIYNALGPIQDTSLRPDSIIYQEFSTPQWLSPVDELLLQLLYHPDIHPGMNAQQCEQVIRSLYE